MCRLERGFGERAVVRDNADKELVQAGEAGDERKLCRLELVEREPSTRRAMISRTSYGLRMSALTMPYLGRVAFRLLDGSHVRGRRSSASRV